MSITVTRNLKLKIDSSFDELSKYNLNRIDTLASILQVNANNQAIIRSTTDIFLQPNSADIGGNGVGGNIYLGSADQPLESLTIAADTVSLTTSGLTLADSATSGTKSLLLQYKSDISGTVDTSSNVTLLMDLNGSNRNLVLGANLSLLGDDFSINTSNLTNSQVLTYNSISGQWTNEDPTGGGGSDTTTATWTPSDGAVRTITHGYGTLNVSASIVDENGADIEIDSIVRPNTTQITLTSNVAPTGNWTVLLQKYGA